MSTVKRWDAASSSSLPDGVVPAEDAEVETVLALATHGSVDGKRGVGIGIVAEEDVLAALLREHGASRVGERERRARRAAVQTHARDAAASNVGHAQDRLQSAKAQKVRARLRRETTTTSQSDVRTYRRRENDAVWACAGSVRPALGTSAES